MEVYLVINVNSLLSYYRGNPDYKIKQVKGTDYNIEFLKSIHPRKNVLVELYPSTGRFYLSKNGNWTNINKLPDVQTDADVIAWIERDSRSLQK
jgi:molybdate-binding protein